MNAQKRRKIAAQSWIFSEQDRKSGGCANATGWRSARCPLAWQTRSSCQAVTTALQLSPSPLIRAATRLHQPFPHHVVSLNATVDLSIFQKTPRTYIRHVYRSLVSTRCGRPRGAK